MKNDAFMKLIATKLPPETELTVELRCREVMACNDIDKLKAFCIDMMKNHAKSEAVLSNAMMRVLELEAHVALLQTKPIKNKRLYKLRLWFEKIKILNQVTRHRKRHSREA